MSIDREPRFVNARQYRRIIKRREWREHNASDLIKISKEKERIARQGYKYVSRHLHAKRRRRGPGGKFLTKKELAELEAKEAAEKKLKLADGEAQAQASSEGGSGTAAEKDAEKDAEEKKGDATFSHPFLHGWTEEQVEDFLQFFDPPTMTPPPPQLMTGQLKAQPQQVQHQAKQNTQRQGNTSAAAKQQV
eukprot:CAMPEP_0170174266 /NCGR_PEP_ID=MMETSP0040_2-20121228/7502_1 /TAXON_ID=641309 /ORGANISM="Lotharella oceanica, Strain CCMP622" /LENGTH=190 /DNA_ID=CAMNT_0010415827 /DNA_START=159 /DNA_END=731 /DNA_ORIENTATION=-